MSECCQLAMSSVKLLKTVWNKGCSQVIVSRVTLLTDGMQVNPLCAWLRSQWGQATTCGIMTECAKSETHPSRRLGSDIEPHWPQRTCPPAVPAQGCPCTLTPCSTQSCSTQSGVVSPSSWETARLERAYPPHPSPVSVHGEPASGSGFPM